MSAKINLHVRGDPEIKLKSDAVDMTKNTYIVENTDYEVLENKPSIEGNELIGDKTLQQLGITPENLDITADSLGITPEDLGMGTADTYDIYMLFHS